MFLIDDKVHWSASDLTLATGCEFAVLRGLDVKLGRVSSASKPADPLMDQIAKLGDQHEDEILKGLDDGVTMVAKLDRAVAPYTFATLAQMRQETIDAFAAGPQVVYQAGFFDGEFLGYADFIEFCEDGWIVSDAKLARQARPKALIQLAAYADQLEQLGVPVAPTVALLLGSGEREEFPLADILPIFRERRERLRTILADRQVEEFAVEWSDERYLACGSCIECAAAAEDANDLLLVAGLRMDQRKRLWSAGIRTVSELGAAATVPEGMNTATFEKLKAQAALQAKQRDAEAAGIDSPVTFELTANAPKTLARIPAPSDGDLFFDFEGDPLYNDGDLSKWGLEYLWGVMEAPEPGFDHGAFKPLWAHDSAEERAALVEFMEYVAARRTTYRDMHIYHYAPYETSALKRLVSRYQTHEQELDELLRAGVFVDLYATVRGSVRVSQPSYSIKKLEPLYMGSEIREGDVQAGDVSVAEYHEFRTLRHSEPELAEKKLEALAEYNEYDCLSTFRLRDWLLLCAEEAGVADQIKSRAAVEASDEGEEPAAERDQLFLDLMAKAEPAVGSARTPEQQAHAMLATALDYYRREERPFWWEHFERLKLPVGEWPAARDVFVAESAEVTSDWHLPTERARNPRREVRLTGDWGPGSTLKSRAHAIYDTPPPKSSTNEDSPLGACGGTDFEIDDLDPRVVRVIESAKRHETYDQTPVALTPDFPPNSKPITAAIRSVAASSLAGLTGPAVFDLLLRKSPRIHGGASLPVSGNAIDDVVAALTAMDSSYIAIQGPPGSGKTWSGSRVIKRLVEEHQWRIGVVAQSHAVVENMLDAIVGAGLDADLIGKSKPSKGDPAWTEVNDTVTHRAKFLADRTDSGCVLGGTVWTMTAADLIEPGGLDLLVIDEAGQFALAPTIGASVSAQRLLLLGDPQQLPQVSQGTHAEPVNKSALGWLMERHDTLPPEHGYFLDCSYRMHADLCRKISVLSYDGRLNAAPETTERRLVGVAPGLEVVTVPHVGNRTESPEEAAAVVAAINDLVGAIWLEKDKADRRLTPTDFLVVTPYNAQVGLIRSALASAGLGAVPVGTVDKVQGQEAPVAIVSMTASSPGDVPRGMGFLLSRNRVNVAVSRAQWKAILVRSPALTGYMPSSTRGVLELGAFVGLCDA